jgi:hypothetical protein
MKPRFEATQAALEHFNSVDQPALDAMRANRRTASALFEFTAAHRLAADRVRAAFLADTAHFNTPENVELMSIEKIRRSLGGTPLGMLLGFLP